MKIVSPRSNSNVTCVFTCPVIFSQPDMSYICVFKSFRKFWKSSRHFKKGTVLFSRSGGSGGTFTRVPPVQFSGNPEMAQRIRRNPHKGSARVIAGFRQTTCKCLFSIFQIFNYHTSSKQSFRWETHSLLVYNIIRSISSSCLLSRHCFVGFYHIIFAFLL